MSIDMIIGFVVAVGSILGFAIYGAYWRERARDSEIEIDLCRCEKAVLVRHLETIKSVVNT